MTKVWTCRKRHGKHSLDSPWIMDPTRSLVPTVIVCMEVPGAGFGYADGRGCGVVKTE